LFVSNSQVIACEDRIRNDLYCVGWGVKLYSIQSLLWTCYGEVTNLLQRNWCKEFWSYLCALQSKARRRKLFLLLMIMIIAAIFIIVLVVTLRNWMLPCILQQNC